VEKRLDEYQVTGPLLPPLDPGFSREVESGSPPPDHSVDKVHFGPRIHARISAQVLRRLRDNVAIDALRCALTRSNTR
jgi:hypothetical protein